MYFVSPVAPTSYFGGFCRYGSDNSENMEMQGITVNNPQKCQQYCMGNTGCVAFSYTNGTTKNCNLYKGGPYTYGNGKRDTTCYSMKGKAGY